MQEMSSVCAAEEIGCGDTALSPKSPGCSNNRQTPLRRIKRENARIGHICNYTCLQGLEHVHTGLLVKWERLSSPAWRSLGDQACTSFSNKLVLLVGVDCWAAGVNGLAECVLVQQGDFAVRVSPSNSRLLSITVVQRTIAGSRYHQRIIIASVSVKSLSGVC